MDRLQSLIYILTFLVSFLGIICKTGLHTWFVFNLFISLYEVYIIQNRYYLNKNHCDDDFWRGSVNRKTLLKDYWNEYACQTDERYFNTDSYVYILEGLNVFFTILLGFAILKNKYIKEVLLLQFLNAVFYFVSLSKGNNSDKDITYKTISSLWLIIPVILIKYN